MAFPKVKISDDSGNAVGITSNRLDVNVAGATMSTGDITIDSEFPAAATITDNFANPSTTSVMSMGMVYDGSAWDMLRGTSADGMLVNLGSNNDVTVSGTVTASAGTNLNTSALSTHAKQDTMITHLSEIEGAIEAIEGAVDGSYLNVNMNLAGSDAQAGEGTITATTQRVTIATDDDGVAHLSTIASGQLANNHNVVVTSAPTTAVTGTFWQTTQPVSGTVTANLSSTDNTVLDNILTKNTEIDAVLDTIKVDTEAIETAVELLDNAISGSEMQVDVVASLPSGSNTIGVVDLGSTDNAVLDAMVVDLAAMEVLLTAANVDHAANEVLLTGIDADTNAIKTAIEGTLAVNVADVSGLATHAKQDVIEATLSSIETDQAAIEVLLTAANVDHAANEVLLTAIDSDTDAIKTAVEIIDNAISGSEMQVDVVAALPAGTNAIGKLAANSGVDIGDVDVTSTVHPAGNGTFNSYAQFTAATTPTALTDATNGVNGIETAAKEVIIQADFDNSAYIMVGDNGAAADTNGIRLNAGDTIILPVADIADIYIDASAGSQTVNVTVIK
jgi:hypothetical protein